MKTTPPNKPSTADQIENYGGGCVWIFALFMYITLAVMVILMGISTSEKIFIPLGAIFLIVLVLFNTWYVYRIVQLKKRIASPLFNQLQHLFPGKIKWPTLWKFTVSPRYQFSWGEHIANVRIVKTNRSAMNQLIAKQLETNQARLQTEMNTKYLLPGWKGTLFRIYFSCDLPLESEYCFFQKTNYSNTLSNAIIGLTGSTLRETLADDATFNSLISCYTNNNTRLQAKLQEPEFRKLVQSILTFHPPFLTKLEMGKKGIFLTTILSSNIKAQHLADALGQIQKMYGILKGE
jgi:hypothetical protein